MVLLVLADVGLPAEVRGVDRLDQQVRFVGRLMLQMQVTAFFGLLALDFMVFRVSGAILDQ